MEVWRDVCGYEGFYQVSNFGRVKRVRCAPGAVVGRVLKPGTSQAGIRNVNLCINSRPRSHTVHRLVATAFLGPPPSDRHQVAHSDGNPSNNRLANLRWATPAENAFDQVIHGTQKGKHYGRPAALTDKQVLAIRADHRPEKQVAVDYGIAPGTVGQIRRRETYQYLPAAAGDYAPAGKRFSFTEDEVRAVRKDSRSVKAIAKERGVSYVTIWSIKTKRSYQDVPDEAETVDPAEPPLDVPEDFNSLRIVGDVGLLPLSKDLTALFDAEDEPLIRAFRWGTGAGKYTHYVTSKVRDETGAVKTVFLHRALMDPPAGMVVDHINGDGLDNRKANLRIVTVAQNNLNSRVRSDSYSGLKGAFYDSRKDSYYSRIKVDGENIWLGTFASAEEAANAYAKASAKYHGEFGRTHLDD